MKKRPAFSSLLRRGIAEHASAEGLEFAPSGYITTKRPVICEVCKRPVRSDTDDCYWQWQVAGFVVYLCDACKQHEAYKAVWKRMPIPPAEDA